MTAQEVEATGRETQAHRIMRYLEDHPGADFRNADIADALGIPGTSCAVSLGYLSAFRKECVQPRRGVVRWVPLDEHYDRVGEARRLAQRIAELLS